MITPLLPFQVRAYGFCGIYQARFSFIDVFLQFFFLRAMDC